jgi:hypothetical protein
MRAALMKVTAKNIMAHTPSAAAMLGPFPRELIKE